jgi:hypothetical protein
VTRVAFLTELQDDDTATDDRTVMAAGRFLCHVEEHDEGGGAAARAADLPLHRALAWGRARAPVVIVQILERDGSAPLYSAGREEPPWPKRERPPRWESHARPLRRRRVEM